MRRRHAGVAGGLLAGILLVPGALAGPAAPPGWTAFPVRLVELEADHPLAALLEPRPLEGAEGGFLFGVGMETRYRYRFEEGDRVEVQVGKKKRRVKVGEGFPIPGFYPGETRPVDLVFRWGLTEDAAAPTLAAAACAVAQIGKRRLTFLDLDASGTFDDFGIDAWLEGDPKAIAKEAAGPEALRGRLRPCEGYLDIEGRRFLVTLRPANRLLAWPVGAGTETGYLRHMGLLNHLRRQAGVPPVGLDESLTAGCEQHSAYCARHGLTHDEDPASPLYTPEGAQAGSRGVLGGHADAVDGLRGMFRTLYHRTYFLWPELRMVGVGVRDGHYTCDVLTHVRRVASGPLPFPFDRQTDVLRRGGLESPDQTPADLQAIAGTLISLSFVPGTRSHLVAARIRDVGRETEVPFAVSTPASPPPAARQRFPDNDATICLYPREVLEPRTVYEVEIRYVLGAARADDPRQVQVMRWRFRTGEAP